jgi:hypothetical protein
VSSPTLEPFSIRLRWEFPCALAIREWVSLLRAYLDDLACSCDEAGLRSSHPGQSAGPRSLRSAQYAGPGAIGHIRLFGAFAEGGYVSGSVASATRPADVEVEGALPASSTSLTFTLNVLVYGLPSDQGRRIAEDRAQSLAAARRGTSTVQSALDQTQPSGDHKPRE